MIAEVMTTCNPPKPRIGFVLLAVSLSSQALDENTVNILTAVNALSMVMTPILILFNEKSDISIIYS